MTCVKNKLQIFFVKDFKKLEKGKLLLQKIFFYVFFKDFRKGKLLLHKF